MAQSSPRSGSWEVVCDIDDDVIDWTSEDEEVRVGNEVEVEAHAW